MAKQEKQELKDGEVTFDFSNIGKAQEMFSKKTSVKEEIPQRSFLFIIHQQTSTLFNEHYYKFLNDTKNYKHVSKSSFFSVCVDYLNQKQNSNVIPEQRFYDFIHRPGKRPKSDRSFHRDNLDKLFIKVDIKYYDLYVKLLYNFLVDKGDEFNPSYSVSYFFYDFIEMIKTNFKSIVQYSIDS